MAIFLFIKITITHAKAVGVFNFSSLVATGEVVVVGVFGNQDFTGKLPEDGSSVYCMGKVMVNLPDGLMFPFQNIDNGMTCFLHRQPCEQNGIRNVAPTGGFNHTASVQNHDFFVLA